MSGSTKGTEFLEIRAKRRNSSVKALRKKYQSGEGQYAGKERALVRVGKGTTNILIGKDDLKDWDDEELRRGQRRSKNGNFTGRAPTVVAKSIHDELVRRTLDNANKMFIENLQNAVEVLCEIVKDDKVDAKDRLTAIKMITERALGRETRVTVDVGGETKWQAAITSAIVPMRSVLEDPDRDN